jgi:cytochrome c peroxidase
MALAHAQAIYAPQFQRLPTVAEMTALGRALFFSPALSASGQQSCASCHSPEHAYGPPNDLAVQFGGRDGRQPGLRAVPSLRYLQTVTAFSEHHFDNDGDDSVDAGPTGGRMWDGRADSAHDQARLPLLSPFEMANESSEAVVRQLKASPLAAQFRATFGEAVFDDPAKAFNALSMALEVFEETPAEFSPFTSKYDAYLRGQTKLTPQEAQGLELFNDPEKGNCASCHISERTPDGAFPLFTDFGHIALGVPRNKAIPANADPAWHDLGTCGPLREDLKGRPEFCGLFRTPTLRNVMTRKVFFHNGRFTNLEDVLRFYALRDLEPERFYPRDAKTGQVQRYDDLPAVYHDNLNIEAPFYGDRGQPRLTEAEIRDVIVFLGTLTDGWQPARGQASR